MCGCQGGGRRACVRRESGAPDLSAQRCSVSVGRVASLPPARTVLTLLCEPRGALTRLVVLYDGTARECALCGRSVNGTLPSPAPPQVGGELSGHCHCSGERRTHLLPTASTISRSIAISSTTDENCRSPKPVAAATNNRRPCVALLRFV